jgi:hypothetical protein
MTKKPAKRTTTADATYVYCVVRPPRGKRPSLARSPKGLAGTGPLRTLEHQGLHVVVTSAPLALYGEAAIHRGLKDLAWVGTCAAAHESVVERMTREGAVVPMKLFTLFESDERAVAHIGKMRARLERVLDRIAGCDEWGVRILLDEVRAARAEVERARAALGSRASGRGFLEMKKKQHDAIVKLSSNARAEADELYDALAGVARAAQRRAAQKELAGRVLLDAVFLVPARTADKFRERVASTAEDMAARGYEVSLTGPWPAYNFVGGAR